MIRALPAGVLVLLSAMAPAAEEPEQLDGDFLEYLAHMEGDDDDWTLVAPPEDTATPEQGQQKVETKAPQPSKQATKPAVDER